MKNSNRIKDGNGRVVLEEIEVRRIWKEYFEDLYKIQRNMLQSTRVALFRFRGVTNSEESRLRELRLR